MLPVRHRDGMPRTSVDDTIRDGAGRAAQLLRSRTCGYSRSWRSRNNTRQRREANHRQRAGAIFLATALRTGVVSAAIRDHYLTRLRARMTRIAVIAVIAVIASALANLRVLSPLSRAIIVLGWAHISPWSAAWRLTRDRAS